MGLSQAATGGQETATVYPAEAEQKRSKPGETDMKLFNMIENFRNDESGAVTVDWVVLTAAIVGLGIVVVASVRTGTTSVAEQIESSLTSATIAELGSLSD